MPGKECQTSNAWRIALCVRRSRKLGRPEAVYQIVEDLRELVHTPDFTWGPAGAALAAKARAA